MVCRPVHPHTRFSVSASEQPAGQPGAVAESVRHGEEMDWPRGTELSGEMQGRELGRRGGVQPIKDQGHIARLI